ncbi:MAG: hypothetical protein RR063_05400, partial [Anaerovoracaceae bacterium]
VLWQNIEEGIPRIIQKSKNSGDAISIFASHDVAQPLRQPPHAEFMHFPTNSSASHDVAQPLRQPPHAEFMHFPTKSSTKPT